MLITFHNRYNLLTKFENARKQTKSGSERGHTRGLFFSFLISARFQMRYANYGLKTGLSRAQITYWCFRPAFGEIIKESVHHKNATSKGRHAALSAREHQK